MTRKRNILALVLFAVYLGAVAYCCFGHFNDLPEIGQDSLFGIPMDKVVHFLMFFPFPILCFIVFSNHVYKTWHTILAVCVVFLAGCLIAAGTEIGQSFTDYRSCDIMDFVADATSLAISSVIVLIIDLRVIKKHHKQVCSKNS